MERSLIRYRSANSVVIANEVKQSIFSIRIHQRRDTAAPTSGLAVCDRPNRETIHPSITLSAT